MGNDKNISKKRQAFNEKHESYSDTELLKEYIYNQELTYDMLNRIRANTSNLVWFLIVIPIIIAVFMAIS